MSFEQQRREFVELAMKLIERTESYYFLIDKDCSFGRRRNNVYVGYFRIEEKSTENETEIQKLRDLVEELGRLEK